MFAKRYYCLLNIVSRVEFLIDKTYYPKRYVFNVGSLLASGPLRILMKEVAFKTGL